MSRWYSTLSSRPPIYRIAALNCCSALMELPPWNYPRSLSEAFLSPPLSLSLFPSLAVLKLAASLSWPPADSDFFVPYSPSTRPPSCRPPPPPPPYYNTLHTTLPSFLPSSLPPQSVQRQGAPVTLVGLGQWCTLHAWPAWSACLGAHIFQGKREGKARLSGNNNGRQALRIIFFFSCIAPEALAVLWKRV